MAARGRRGCLSPSFPVVLLIFLMACSQIGTVQTIGLYLDDIAESLGTGSVHIGVASGLFLAFSCFPAPVIAALYQQKTYRRYILACGSVFVPLGVILTAFSTDNVFISVFLSVSGLGNCMLTMSAAMALDQHCNNGNFHLLYAVGMSGFGLGMVLLPFLAHYLREAYGWRGGFLVIGGLVMHLIPCAMAIEVEDRTGIRKGFPSRTIGDSIHGSICPPKHSPNVRCFGRNRDFTSTDEHSRYQLLQQGGNPEVPSRISAVAILKGIIRLFHASDFYQDPVINFLLAASTMTGIMYCGWQSFLVPHVLERGYSSRCAIVTIFFASLGNVSGRLIAGALSVRIISPTVLYLCSALLNAGAILCDVFAGHYYLMLATTCLTAGGMAGITVLAPLALRDRASPASFGIAYSLHELCFGVGTFLGGYLSGLVGHIFSTYDATFIFIAAVNVTIVLLLLPPLLMKRSQAETL